MTGDHDPKRDHDHERDQDQDQAQEHRQDDDREVFDPELDAIEDLLRTVTPDDLERLDPPPDLWERIEAETGVGTRPGAEAASVTSLDERRRRVDPLAVLGAAAAVLIAVVGLTLLLGGLSGGDDEPVPLAQAELAYDPGVFDELGADASARVSLIDETGRLRVQIDESDLPDVEGEAADLELWLIEPDADGKPADLVSLGLIDPADPGRFDIPAGYDPEVFFVVDISVEPRDGDANHSGRSILRGPLA